MYGVITWHERTFIAECTAITQYLDALDQRTTLSGQTAVEQGRIHMQCYGQWSHMAGSTLSMHGA
ncbi:hypothetical protein [Xanthomonas campestris]|uniref:hypothetical protein n=1 Tax=Xanthomonas campestris TaxID=339 RepID=UPI0036DD2BDE